ncbi:uncharacterized protein LOC125371088 [Ricinus communis]|uniref:uncharacterized protein LOC125371088 n=1 Tax=Ricinus communis TaxID=3988 RepID=UPI00201ADF1E|nr:uncharacterized protein LOC125371088 [Ricinus communis]
MMSRNMEEISETAIACYANLSSREKRLAKKFFQAMDTDGDGKISFEEYEQYIKTRKGFKTITSPDFFKKLDKDGNGTLSFDEFITLHYVCSSERVYFCDECKVFLAGVYFTCVQCFNGSGNTYDLCCSCYHDKDINHHKDAVFLDNYTLLQALREQNKASGSQRKSGVSGRAALANFGVSTISTGPNFGFSSTFTGTDFGFSTISDSGGASGCHQ